MKFFTWLWKILRDKRGQVPAEDGGKEEETTEAPAEETSVAEESSTETTEPAQAEKPKDFLSDSRKRAEIMALINGNPALKQAYGWMNAAYSKKIGRNRELEEKAALVDRFNSDRDFAIQTIQNVAAQHGYTITRAQANAVATGQAAMPGTSAAAPSVTGVPPEYVEMVKSTLPPELQWMAESLAKSQYAITQQAVTSALRPYQEQTQKQTLTQRESEYDRLADELAAKAPGWEEHEDEMNDLLDFIASDRMTHKKWGSKLELLFNMATSNAAAVAEASRRMSQAGRNRGSASRTTSSSLPNVGERIRKAPTNNAAWDLAMRHAIAETERGSAGG